MGNRPGHGIETFRRRRVGAYNLALVPHRHPQPGLANVTTLSAQPVTYRKAPLVELIVEVRWPVPTIPAGGAPPIVGGRSTEFDLWFQQLTEGLRAQGFHNLERLVPHDMFVLAHQPLYRYGREGERFPIVQFGHGIFTVNAGPPHYQSWASFRPQVETALGTLTDRKPSAANAESLSLVALRYIDRFDQALRQGASNFSFIRDQLGVTIQLPPGLIELAPHPDRILPALRLTLPIADRDNANLAFQIAAGRLGDSQTVDTIMDMTYSVTGEIPLAPDAVLACLDHAHDVMHGWFDQLTARIRERMEPENPG